MEYKFRDIEKKWQEWWSANKVYQVPNGSPKPKCYVLDMFPYPSGAGLHVGHPLGYIASDIYSRYKRLKGFNVLHPMGFDSFGLPAEQYALDTGQHPAVTTKKNIATFKAQLNNIGFCYDWEREIQTSDPQYYKWTQWIFLQLFGSFYNRNTNKAEPVTNLVAAFEKEGNAQFSMPNLAYRQAGVQYSITNFAAEEWKGFDERTRQDILMQYRLAYCGYGEVNWCEALGTVLANDEVVNGVSERGGYPVVKKKLRQWYLRITEYADRLLEGLDKVDFSEAMKEMQTNWIGKSSGAEIDFRIRIGEPVETRTTTYQDSSLIVESVSVEVSESEQPLTVYTTRPDTIFGVDFMVIAPEHYLVEEITTAEQKQVVDDYIAYVKSRSERERMAEKKITGVFTGAHCIHPFIGKEIPIWIAEYVLAGYGTGAIMAVPCGDERDHKFAKHFNIPITNIIGKYYNGEEANPTKDAILENSDFINGIVMKDAIDVVINKIEELKIGVRKVNYKMRDAAFSRQRYWGEPFPIVWKDNIAYPLDEKDLPLELPHVDSYKPGPEGEGPLANIPDWVHQKVKLQKPPQTPPKEGLRHAQGQLLEDTNTSESLQQTESSQVPSLGGDLGEAGALETNTMPGYAGSSWYFLRYMDPHNDKTFCDRKVADYWNQVDIYVGGTEHAVGHLLYSRMWTKALYDLGYIGFDEPYKKLVNQGMIVGQSFFTHVDFENKLVYPNYHVKEAASNLIKIRVPYAERFFETFGDLDIANKDLFLEEINCTGFKLVGVDVTSEYVNSENAFDFEMVIEKMSKSKHNTVNPDDIIAKYGSDTFRMYEMFLGPVEMSKPWDTKGIEGVHRFLKKFWRLFYDDVKGKVWNEVKANDAELKVLHKAIKKIEEDTERFSFNTAVSAFMIATNELTDLKCHKRSLLEPLLILLAPYAPHIAEELYHQLQKPPQTPPKEGLANTHGQLDEESMSKENLKLSDGSKVLPQGATDPAKEAGEGWERSSLGGASSILNANYPKFEAKYIIETSKEYPISINGKLRTTITISLDATQAEVEKIVSANEVVQKWLAGKPPKKVIYVKNKMINVVI